MGVRFDKEFNKEIRDTVRAFNNKLNSNYAKPLKIPKVSVKAIKGLSSRREIKRVLNELRQFNEKTARETFMDNVILTKWEKQIYKKRKARQLRRLTLREKKVKENNIIYGRDIIKSINEERAVLNREIVSNRQFRFNQSFLNTSLNLNKRATNYHSNFEDIISKVALSYGFPKNKLTAYFEKLKKLSPQELLSYYELDERLKNLTLRYKPAKDNDFLLNQDSSVLDIFEGVVNDLDTMLSYV